MLIQRMRQILDERDGQVARVLLADDDPMVAAYVRKVLPEDRFRLEVVNNGEECPARAAHAARRLRPPACST